MWLLFSSYIENLDLTEGRGEHAQCFPEVTPQRVRESLVGHLAPIFTSGHALSLGPHLTVLHNPLMNLLPSGRKEEEKEPGPSPRQWKPQH